MLVSWTTVAAENDADVEQLIISEEIIGKVLEFLPVSEALRLENEVLKDKVVKETLRKESCYGVKLEDESFLYMQEFISSKAYKTKKIVNYNEFEKMLQSVPVSRYNLVWQESACEQIKATASEEEGVNAYLDGFLPLFANKIRGFLTQKESEISVQDWGAHAYSSLGALMFINELVSKEFIKEIELSSTRAVACYRLNLALTNGVSLLSFTSAPAFVLAAALERTLNEGVYDSSKEAQRLFDIKYVRQESLRQLRENLFGEQLRLSAKKVAKKYFRFWAIVSGSSREVKKARKQSLKPIQLGKVSFRTSEKIVLLKLFMALEKMLPELYEIFFNGLNLDDLDPQVFQSKESWQNFKANQLGVWIAKKNHITNTMLIELDQMLERKLFRFAKISS